MGYPLKPHIIGPRAPHCMTEFIDVLVTEYDQSEAGAFLKFHTYEDESDGTTEIRGTVVLDPDEIRSLHGPLGEYLRQSEADGWPANKKHRRHWPIETVESAIEQQTLKRRIRTSEWTLRSDRKELKEIRTAQRQRRERSKITGGR